MPVEAPKPQPDRNGGKSVRIEIAVAEPLTDLYGGTFQPAEVIPGLKPAGKANQAEPKQGVVAPMVFDALGGDQD